MKILTAPDPVTAAAPRPWLFLAGAIDQGRAEPWQRQVGELLAELPGTILDPRRAAWDARWGQHLDDPRFAGQVAWELDAMERADLIACWLPTGSQAPVSLLELGLHARGGRLLVGCPLGFHRHGNVDAVCRRHGVPLALDLPGLLALVHGRLACTETPSHGTAPVIQDHACTGTTR